MIGDSHVNTVRVARTWEHWWHGNACFRAQGDTGDRAGFKFGDEARGSQALCPPQLSYLSLLGQASTESQGPWDSNYQVEDDFSWFIPGKSGDHELKFGARYNYTELERVSQINENGTFTFNSDLPFDPPNPRTYPERLTIRMGNFNEFIKNHSFELYAQDKWKMGGRTTLSIGVRYDLEIIPLDETGNPLFQAGDEPPGRPEQLRAAHRLHARVRRPRQVGHPRRLRAVLQPHHPGRDRRRARIGQVHVVERRQLPERQRRSGADRGPLPDRSVAWCNGPFVNRTLLNQLFPPGANVKQRRRRDLRRAGIASSRSRIRRRSAIARELTGDDRRSTPTTCTPRTGTCSWRHNLNPMVRANTTRTGAITRVDAFGVLGEAYTEQVWVMENTGYNDYDALNLSLEKRYAEQLVGPHLVLAVEIVWNGGKPERQEHLPDR